MSKETIEIYEAMSNDELRAEEKAALDMLKKSSSETLKKDARHSLSLIRKVMRDGGLKSSNPQDEDEELEADEEDIFLSPSGPLGSRTSVSAGGKFLGEFAGDDEAEEAARKWAEKNKFYPNAWQVSDHGNYHLISDFWKKKEKNPNRVEVDSRKVGDGRVVLWKNVETKYKVSPARIGTEVTYSVVSYNAAGEAQEEGSEFGIKKLAEAKQKFKKLTSVSKNPKDPEPSRELLLDESRGIYIPKKFVENFDTELWHVDEELVAELKEGPDGENYWEAWEAVLSDAWLEQDGKRWNLEQDGDLFAVHYEVQ